MCMSSMCMAHKRKKGARKNCTMKSLCDWDGAPPLWDIHHDTCIMHCLSSPWHTRSPPSIVKMEIKNDSIIKYLHIKIRKMITQETYFTIYMMDTIEFHCKIFYFLISLPTLSIYMQKAIYFYKYLRWWSYKMFYVGVKASIGLWE